MIASARTKPRWTRESERICGNSAFAEIRSDSGNFVTGFRHGPLSRPVTSSSATGLRSSVVTTSSMPRWTRISAGPSAHSAPPSAPITAIAAIASGRGNVAYDRAGPRGSDRPSEQLSLGADVPEAGAEGDRDGGAREEERRRSDEHLERGEAGGQRIDDERSRRRSSGLAPAARTKPTVSTNVDRDRCRCQGDAEPPRRRRPRLQAHRDHAACSSPRPAISSPNRSGSASAAAKRPTILPS